MVRTLASKALARRSSGGASSPAISTVPATRSPCSMGVTPKERLLFESVVVSETLGVGSIT